MTYHDPLKPREIEILRLMADGLTNREIAEQLFIGFETVKWYAKQIYSKLDVSSRRAAADKAQELGLLDERDEQSEQGGDRIQNKLPKQTMPFIGRQSDIDALMQRVEDESNRLVTILASGGMGKTRLAIEVANQQIESHRYTDGVYFIPLQPLSASENIYHAIASNMGYQSHNDQRPLQQQVLDFLSVKNALLVMDNWEHLLDGVPIVVDIIKAAPSITILATSREKLSLSSELVYVLSGMEFPTWETPEDALEYDAVKLLLHAAQQVKPDWAVTHANLNFVARVCRLTAGMPLAIILAMSWLDMLSIEEITVEIQKNVDFLETEMRDIPERQRSIRAIFDYTWHRLTPTERDIFMKLSVFRGGFTREAVETVTSATLRNLHRLVEKALISRSPEGRFDVHELLRQYGEIELEASTVAQDVSLAHATYYLNHLSVLEPQIKGRGQDNALVQINVEFENIHKAWHDALSIERFALIDQACEALVWAMDRVGREEDAERLLQSVKSQLGDSSTQVLLISRLTQYTYFLSRSTLDLDNLYHARAQIAELSDESQLMIGYLAEGWISYISGNMTQALQAVHTAYRLAETFGDLFYMGYALNRIGFYEFALGNLDTASFTFEASEIQREIGDIKGLTWSLANLGALYMYRLQYDLAENVLNEALEIAATSQTVGRQDSVFVINALLYAQVGDFNKLEEFANLAYTSAYNNQHKNLLGQAEFILGILALSRSDFVACERHANVTLDYLTSRNPVWTAPSQLLIAISLVGQNHIAKAKVYLLRAANISFPQRTPHTLKWYFIAYGLYLAAVGHHKQATMMLAFAFSEKIDAYHWFKDIEVSQDAYHKLQRELDSESFAEAWQHGTDMSYDDAEAYIKSFSIDSVD